MSTHTEKIREALEAGIDCLSHHSEWCGHFPGSNGHPSIHDAPRKMHAALAALDELERQPAKVLTDEEIDQLTWKLAPVVRKGPKDDNGALMESWHRAGAKAAIQYLRDNGYLSGATDPSTSTKDHR